MLRDAKGISGLEMGAGEGSQIKPERYLLLKCVGYLKATKFV